MAASTPIVIAEYETEIGTEEIRSIRHKALSGCTGAVTLQMKGILMVGNPTIKSGLDSG